MITGGSAGPVFISFSGANLLQRLVKEIDVKTSEISRERQLFYRKRRIALDYDTDFNDEAAIFNNHKIAKREAEEEILEPDNLTLMRTMKERLIAAREEFIHAQQSIERFFSSPEVSITPQ